MNCGAETPFDLLPPARNRFARAKCDARHGNRWKLFMNLCCLCFNQPRAAFALVFWPELCVDRRWLLWSKASCNGIVGALQVADSAQADQSLPKCASTKECRLNEACARILPTHTERVLENHR